MMRGLITLERAKREKEWLENYIYLIESYEVDTLEKWVIKQYAITNSMNKIMQLAEEKGITYNNEPLDREYLREIINGKIMDELHRTLRKGYGRKSNLTKEVRCFFRKSKFKGLLKNHFWQSSRNIFENSLV